MVKRFLSLVKYSFTFCKSYVEKAFGMYLLEFVIIPPLPKGM
jgi:hypothetical protein